MDTETLQIFIETARAGSFAKVAKTRNLDPSSISRAIAALESEIGTLLFQRTTRRLNLTEAGEQFLTRMTPALEELLNARDEATSDVLEPRGNLRITASVAFGHLKIVPLLPTFTRRYPNIGIECNFTDDTLDLVAHRIDLAVRLAPSITGDWVATKLLDTRYRVVATPGYLDSNPPLNRPDNLRDHDCLLQPYRGFRTAWRFRDHDGNVSEVPVRGKLLLSSALAIRDAAKQGLGPALVAEWLVNDAVSAGELIDLFPGYAVTATSFETAAWLVYPTRRFLPPQVRVLIDFLKQSQLQKK